MLLVVWRTMNGKLFTVDFLREGIRDTTAWKDVNDETAQAFVDQARAIFATIPPQNRENEGVTESQIIKPILGLLGWSEILPVQNLSSTGREEVPDLLLFADQENYQRALKVQEEYRRYRHGLAIAESKRWELPLDRPEQNTPDVRAPSSKML